MHTPYENVTTANGFGAAELSHFRVDAEERREIQEALVKRGMLGEVEVVVVKSRETAEKRKR